MIRILNFFVIGLLVGLAGLYQHYRNRELSAEIQLLRQQVSQGVASAVSTHSPAAQTFDLIPPPTLPGESATQKEINESRQNAITRAIASTSDAVVGINVTQVREVRNPWLTADPLAWMLFDDRLRPRTFQKVQNLGSGFIISPDGYIATNEHVVRDASEVIVTTTSQKKYEAKVVGVDPLLDMALLKIEANGLPSIPLADSDQCIVGEWVIAIGNPYGLFDVNDQPSVSVGVISALHRDFASKIDGRIYTDMIQTDASINRGNSGGPLVNAEGEAIGMCTLIFSESGGSVGVGFAIPSNRLLAAIQDLRHGPINRNYWIGIRASDITPTLARLHKLEKMEGALVTSVEPGSPAAKAGIRIEDVLLELNGKSVRSATSARELLQNMDIRVGDQLPVVISRKGKRMEFVLNLTPLPK